MQTIKITGLMALFMLVLATTSCVEDIFIEGNGHVRTENRRVSGFDKVTSSGDFEVIVVPGEHYSVEVTAESNLLPYIETDVVGNTLKIHTRGLYSLRESETIEIYITTPVLNGLTLSGSGLIQAGSFNSKDFYVALSGSGNIDAQVNADRIKANVSGSGSVLLEGDTFESEFVISGSGKIKAFKLEQDHCEAVISGSGNMYVNAYETIEARISGSGNVFYINFPVIHTSISGSGRVIDKN